MSMPVPGCLTISAILTPALCLQSSGGELADEATPRLGDIRARRRANGQELRRNIEQWARDLGQRGVSEHGQPMVRRNRQCVSVKRSQQVSCTCCTLSWSMPSDSIGTVQHWHSTPGQARQAVRHCFLLGHTGRVS